MLFFPIAPVKKKLSYFGILVMLLGSLISCQPSLIEIGTIKDKRKGKVVYLTGKVTQVAPFVDNGAYQLQDDTGGVWIVTESNLPSFGKVISIKGKIQYQSLPLGDRDLGDFYIIELEKLALPPKS
jgi:hypothetical protein